MDKNQEIIELIINGKDEYSDVSEKVRNELFELSDSAAETQREFTRLSKAIDLSDTYRAQEAELNRLVDAQALSRAEVVKLSKANRDAGESNLELASNTARAKAELSSLRAATNRAQKAFDKTAESVRRYGVDVDDVKANQAQYRAETEKLGAAITELNIQQTKTVQSARAEIAVKQEQIAQAQTLAAQQVEEKKRSKELYATQKENRKELKNYSRDIVELVSQLKKGNIEWSEFEAGQSQATKASKLNRIEIEKVNRALASQASVARETGQAARTEKLTVTTAAYAKQIEALVGAYRKGEISASAFNRTEKEVREALELTEIQTRNTRKEQNAYTDDLNKQIADQKKVAAEITKVSDAKARDALATKQSTEAQAAAKNELKNYTREVISLIVQLKKGNIEWADYQRQLSQTKEASAAKRVEIAKVNKALESQVQTVKKYRDEQSKLNAETAKQSVIESERAKDAAKVRVEIERVELATQEYRKELNLLVEQYKDGTISSQQFSRAEKDVRQSLNLTEAQVRETRKELDAYSDQMDRAAKGDLKKSKSTDTLTKATRRLAQGYTVLLAAQKAIQAVGSAVTQYADTEEAMLSLKKTTGLTTSELQDFREAMTDLSNNQTATVRDELIGIAEAAGRMGVRGSENLVAFTKSIDALQSATDLTSESASTAVARILELSGESQESIANIASAISALGQNVAASESEIVHFAQRLASTTAEAELSAAEILGLSASLAGMGMQAEGASNVIGRTFREINGAIQGGGEELDKLSALMGMSGDALTKAFSEDKTLFLRNFIASIRDAQDGGRTLNEILSSMNLSSDENARVLGTLVKQYESLSSTIEVSNRGFESGVEHFREAATQAASLTSVLDRTKNQYRSLIAITGEAFSDDLARKISLNVEEMKKFERAAAIAGENLAEITEVALSVAKSIAGVGNTFDALLQSFTGGTVIQGVTNTILLMGVAIDGLVLTFAKAARAQNRFFNDTEDVEFWEKQVGGAMGRIAEKERILQLSAERAVDGVSHSFQDLRTAYFENKDALDLLDPVMLKNIQTVIFTTGHVKGAEKGQRLMTEAIRQAATATRIFTGYTEEENVLLSASVAIHQATGKSIEEATEFAKAEIETKREKLKLLEEEKLALESNKAAVDLSNEAVLKQIDVAIESAEAAEVQRARLEGLTTAEIEHEISVSSAEEKLRLKKEELERTTLGSASYTATLREVILAEKELASAQGASTDLLVLGIDNISAAKTAYEQYTAQVELLNQKIQSGHTITSEDLATKERAEAILVKLKSLYGELGDAVDKDTGKTKANTEAVDENTESRDKNSEAHKVMIQLAGKSASEWQSASSTMAEAYEKLIVKMQDTQKQAAKISGTIRTYVKRWREAYNSMQRDAQDLSDQFDRQTKSAARLSEQLENGADLTAEQLDNIETSVESLSKLDDSTLDSLRSQIARVRAEMEGLSDAAEQTLSSLKDEVDNLKGNDEDIENRDYKQRLEELQEQRDTADAQGNSEASGDLSEAIRLLKEAHSIRLQEIAQQRQADAVDEAQDQQESTQTNTDAPRTITVNVGGVDHDITVTDQTSEAELIAMLEELEEVSA